MSDFDIEDAMEQAVALHLSGDLDAAEGIYRQVIGIRPDDPDALHLLGVIVLARGRVAEAVELLARAAVLQDSIPEYHVDLARALWAAGKLDEALQSARQACTLDSACGDGWILCGHLHSALRNRREAAGAFAKAADLRPDNAIAHRLLAEALLASAQGAAAIEPARSAVRLNPDDPVPHFVLGNALRADQQFGQAENEYLEALRISPDYIEARLHLASVQWAMGRRDQAVANCRAVVERRGDFADAHHALGMALEKSGQYSAAADSYREALRLNPDNHRWRFDLAAVAGELPPAPPSDFVARLFDEYAPKFENHLVNVLHYHIPERLLEHVAAATSRRDLDIMDLGCGTGLCGKLFHGLARSIVGVDLSSHMVEIAQRTGFYSRVEGDHALAALRRYPAAFDLILAADVFVYIGELSEIFTAAAAALRPAGLFAFSLESQEVHGFALQRTRRYTHSLSYVQELAIRHGFECAAANRVEVRLQERQPVQGWTVLLHKPPR